VRSTSENCNSESGNLKLRMVIWQTITDGNCGVNFRKWKRCVLGSGKCRQNRHAIRLMRVRLAVIGIGHDQRGSGRVEIVFSIPNDAELATLLAGTRADGAS
jgi:hypothetical protein